MGLGGNNNSLQITKFFKYFKLWTILRLFTKNEDTNQGKNKKVKQKLAQDSNECKTQSANTSKKLAHKNLYGVHRKKGRQNFVSEIKTIGESPNKRKSQNVKNEDKSDKTISSLESLNSDEFNGNNFEMKNFVNKFLLDMFKNKDRFSVINKTKGIGKLRERAKKSCFYSFFTNSLNKKRKSKKKSGNIWTFERGKKAKVSVYSSSDRSFESNDTSNFSPNDPELRDRQLKKQLIRRQRARRVNKKFGDHGLIRSSVDSDSKLESSFKFRKNLRLKEMQVENKNKRGFNHMSNEQKAKMKLISTLKTKEELQNSIHSNSNRNYAQLRGKVMSNFSNDAAAQRPHSTSDKTDTNLDSILSQMLSRKLNISKSISESKSDPVSGAVCMKGCDHCCPHCNCGQGRHKHRGRVLLKSEEVHLDLAPEEAVLRRFLREKKIEKICEYLHKNKHIKVCRVAEAVKKAGFTDDFAFGIG